MNREERRNTVKKLQKKGWYYVHVTTEDGEPVDDDTLYALQLQMGDTYKHDYMTHEQFFKSRRFRRHI